MISKHVDWAKLRQNDLYAAKRQDENCYRIKLLNV